MSAFTGAQGRGAAKTHQRAKRDAAKTRQRHHDQAVLAYSIEHGVPEDEARKVVRLMGYVAHTIQGPL